jgi:hypothetical protein
MDRSRLLVRIFRLGEARADGALAIISIGCGSVGGLGTTRVL